MSEHIRDIAKDILLSILPNEWDDCENDIITVTDQPDQHRAYLVVDINFFEMFPESVRHAMREHAIAAVAKFFQRFRGEFPEEVSALDDDVIDFIMNDTRFVESRNMRITVMLLGSDIPKYGFIMVDPEERLTYTSFTRDPSIMYGTVLGFPAQDFQEMADYIRERLETHSGLRDAL